MRPSAAVSAMPRWAPDHRAAPARLRGRDAELSAFDDLLEAVRGGASRALVLRGEPGVGKTALLEALGERALGCQVARAAGMQAEMELPFAGLHLLCAPMLDQVDRLPGPQQQALRTAFGLSAGPVPDRFLVGLATLTLLSEGARDRPLICLIDDAQWLDRASADVLAFVARRLLAESVGLVLAAREEHELAGLPELRIGGLGYDDARALLRAAIGVPLDEQVTDRIVAETNGNPLALLELPGGLSPAQLAGGFGLPGALPLSRRIEASFQRRLAALPAQSRTLLLVAAAEPVGDPVLAWRAAERLGVDPEAPPAVELGGLCEFGARVRFRHPLARSAIYQAASPEARRAVHGALAEATDPTVDPDRRAWHRAHATAGLDEEVAAQLERSAGRAQMRGGLAAAAAFLERAAALTPSPALRARRTLEAAEVDLRAGALDAARPLLAAAAAGPLNDCGRTRLALLRGQLAFASSRGSEAPPLLLSAARRLEPVDPDMARETYLDAFTATLFGGRLTSADGVLELAEAVRAATPPARRRPRDLLLAGLAELVADGYPAGAAAVQRALTAFHGESISSEEGLRWLWLAGHAGAIVWDFDTWRLFAIRHLQLVRDAGALSLLPIALSTRTGAHLLAGELAEAERLVQEAATIAEAMDSPVFRYGELPLAALRGREAQATELIAAGVDDLVERGEGLALTSIRYAAGMLYNGLGRYEQALEAMQADEHPAELWSATVSLPELIEVAVRSGRPDIAGDGLRRLSLRTSASGTDWALGMEARSQALVTEGPAAEPLYQVAIDRLRRTGVRVEHARAELLYGEWLRRERRRVEARERLRIAHEMLAAMGLEAFAQRAERELRATGAKARKRTVDIGLHLTPQESQIARLAVDGLSNPEIGARLFISPRTVQYHLRKVFMKLNITSRNQLHRVLAGEHDLG
jgi:DNA-binding CsgD family transcriptional regulator